MKATRGLIPNNGIVPFSKSQDVAGVFARNLQDLSLMLSVMAGKEFAPATNVSIGFLDDDDLNDPEQTPEAMRDAYDELRDQFSTYGSSPRIPRVPYDLYAKLFQLLDAELERDLSHYLENRAGSRWSSLQDAVNEGATLEFDPSTGELLSLPLEGFERALYADPIDIAPTRKKIERQFTNILEPLFQDSDVIVAPAYSPAEKLDLKRGYRTRARTYMSYLDGLSSVVGWPSLTIPFTQVGKLPAGLVMVARAGGEARLLGAAATIALSFNPPLWRAPIRG
jgi:Asp-tRNA(Asn)/Glu-tRNA(Gln) amidotransferase A subunit family amidase